jgi:hypothetical protein
MAEHNTYSQTEIANYLQRKMSSQEMHEFEKALMKDPFLADAVEGYSSGNLLLAEKHLANLEMRLMADREQAKVVQIPAQKNAWWKVAAIVFVVVTVGTITFSVVNTNFSSTENAIAVSGSNSASIEKDSIGPKERQPAPIQMLPEQQPGIARNAAPIVHPDRASSPLQNNELAKASGQSFDQKETNGAATSMPVPTSRGDIALAQQSRLSRATDANEFRGKVVDNSGDPLPFATISGNNRKLETASDANGKFSFRAADTALEVSVTAPGYSAAMATINSNKPENKVILKEEELSLAEVVITQLSKNKKSSAIRVHGDSAMTAEPVGGWKRFTQYVGEAFESFRTDGTLKNKKGENIELEFSIDADGQPTTIKAQPGLDKLLADKAIEILANGPRWKNEKKDKKVKVIIGF